MSNCSKAILMFAVATLVAGGQTAQAQFPPTVWHALGIPQTATRLKDGTSNRWGLRPNSERTPPITRLADPKNLESKNPAIKKAAEIKAEEDLKPQKIKALKYLASIGCGCYDGVAEAFMAALEDCTEEVRYVAARSIAEAAGNRCTRCNSSCCSKELVAKMTERAYERDEEGCFLEASERVREALKDAIRTCCPCRPGEEIGTPSPDPDMRPTPDVRPMPDVRPTPDTIPTPPLPPPPVTTGEADRQAQDEPIFTPASTHGPATRNAPALLSPSAQVQPRQQPQTQAPTKTLTSSRRTWQNKAVQVSAEEEVMAAPQSRPAVSTRRLPPPPVAAATQVSATEAVQNVPAVAGPIRGQVAVVNRERGLVEIHFQGNAKPARGDEVLVYHNYLLGRELLGSLQVVGIDGDHVIASFRGSKTFRVASGDEAVIDNPSALSRR